MPEHASFDPYTYGGSPNVEQVYGYAVMMFAILLFAIINYAVIIIGPPRSMSGDVWRWRNTLISWLHAVIVGIGVLYSLMYKRAAFEDGIIYCDYYLYLLVAFSLGYFTYDFLDHVVNKKLVTNWEVIAHHIPVLWSFSYGIIYRVNIPYIIIALMTEVNSIFLHGRKLMLFNHVPLNNYRYRIVIVLNLVTFVCFRMIAVGAIACAIYIEGDKVTLIYKILLSLGMVVMLLVNPVLLYRLFKNDVLRNLKKNSKQEMNGLGVPLMNGTTKQAD